MITFEGTPIDPSKPLYVVCGRITQKGKNGYPLHKAEQRQYLTYIKAFRGSITGIYFDPDMPGTITRLDLWFSAMDTCASHLYAGNGYYIGSIAQEARKAYENARKEEGRPFQ